MAKKNPPQEENNVLLKLKAVARLQSALTSIDKIRTLRGELPLEVQDIEDDITGTQTRLEHFSTSAKALTQSIAAEKNKIASTKELLQKYKKQIDNVRNNREYDNLSKEIEYQELEVLSSEKKIKEYTNELQGRKTEIARLKEKIELRQGDLSAKKNVLESIIKETQEEEEKLKEEARALEKEIQDQRLLDAFYRIRNGCHNGLAVVPIDRDACGGCFNRIPPQRQLEIRLAQKIIVCEYCGRIIVDHDFLFTPTEETTPEVTSLEEAEEPTKRSTRKNTKAKTSEQAPKKETTAKRTTKKESSERKKKEKEE